MSCCDLLARSQGPWQNSRVPFESHPASVGPLDERRKAARQLELLDLCEPVARRAEAVIDGLLRQAFARRYRELVGIDPERRHELRQALQQLDGALVADVVASLGGDPDYPNSVL